jgi:tRNA(Ile)-lysidine synthase
MSFLSANLNPYLPPVLEGAIWWVGFSGGLDSCVLLHALASLPLPVTLRALHINHQLSSNANRWQQHCATFCEALAVPFSAVSVSVKNTGRGIEDAARKARYSVFEQHLQGGDYLLTAHHADDQTETLLLHLMRGTGPRGLAAMVASRALAAGTLSRPLLHFTRAELEDYARHHHLVWVEDESNQNDHYDRNYLRNNVMPLLKARWPDFAQKWQQTSELCATHEMLVEDLAAQDMASADFRRETLGTSILLPYFCHLSVARRNNLLRVWSRGQGVSIPAQQHLLQIDRQVIAARDDAKTQVTWGDTSLRIYRDRLYLLPMTKLSNTDIAAHLPIPFSLTQDSFIDLPHGGQLRFTLSDFVDTPLLNPELLHLEIRFRKGGERCRPLGRAHSQTLKHLLQDYGIPPWMRESLPLVYSGDELVAVSDLWICEGYAVEADGYRLKFKYL